MLPTGTYEPPAVVTSRPDGLTVHFHGEDGRRFDYVVGALPLTGWHSAVAASLSGRLGPEGVRRTRASADDLWGTVRRFLRFLSELPEPPSAPSLLTVTHLDGFLKHRSKRIGPRSAAREFGDLAGVLRSEAFDDIPARSRDYLLRRHSVGQLQPRPGYSDNEFNQLQRAARADVAAIRDRIRSGQDLLARFVRDADALSPQHRHLAEQLSVIAESGIVPVGPGSMTTVLPERITMAAHLFLTLPDLAPLLVLLVAVTGHNIETIKELPAEHRVLEGRAVELQVIKRRRGRQHWHSTVTWEIGPPGRELHTPGGLYLLLHELTSAGREFVKTAHTIWNVWGNGHRLAGGQGMASLLEHRDPFANSLNGATLRLDRWAARHALTLDASVDAEDLTGVPLDPQPLPVSFNRIRTSVEVRRTRRMGGHLPSAARTNSVPVLFSSYLRGDPTLIDWAQQVVGEAFVDAEQSALAAHRRALEAAGGAITVISGPVDTEHLQQAGLDPATGRRAVDGELDTAWAECVDHDHHPGTGRPCRASFLDCFHCGNCLVTRNDLPRLLALLEALAGRRQELSEQDWWHRYGSSWAAIRHDILVKFTPAELDRAAANKPVDARLDLVEQPWQKP
ncbi:hypothetical protein [Mycobacteroides abscessus]|uniref:hypothetical protein n=1 Tax=Mycobacteroides abscessus TaxID=36809 RepID=UPI000C258500|nr:hypothetical protein [Mycobacteroides abscessus]